MAARHAGVVYTISMTNCQKCVTGSLSESGGLAWQGITDVPYGVRHAHVHAETAYLDENATAVNLANKKLNSITRA